MSFKFSHRSTRVQHTPHVCETPPKLPPGDPWSHLPADALVDQTWGVLDGSGQDEVADIRSVNRVAGTNSYQGVSPTIEGGNCAWTVTLDSPTGPGHFAAIMDSPIVGIQNVTADLPVSGAPPIYESGPVDPEATPGNAFGDLRVSAPS